MKKLNYLFSLFALAATVVISSCSKDKEVTPDANPDAKVFTVAMTSNHLTPTLDTTVSTSDGTVKLRLDVTSSSNIDQIFIMKSVDNGSLTPQTFSTITNSYGTFTGGSSSYSFKVPNSTNSFILDVPVSVRTTSAAVTDVYYIWITSGTGSFVKPTKNTVMGPAVVTLKYSATAAGSYSSATGIALGDQNATPGSLLVTSGQVSALLTADYIDAPQSADISLSALNAAGTTKTNNSGILWLISPSLRAGLGYAGCASCGAGGTALAEPTPSTGANTTYIASYSGSFDAANATTLSNLNVGTSTQAKINAVGDVFMFQTAKGKKGLITITSLNASVGSAGTVTVSIKVQN